ncbi:MAG TPA: hypothetical protein VHN80_22400 [Kineosporiaceae bacterium]|nr:hypothetical protein [Kineosporiaceae bacterium]
MELAEQKRTAFAVSGLGGNNAYGAGFLAAVQEATRRQGITEGLYPGLEMISCTSGAIASTATYLSGGDLRAQVKAGIDAVDRATWLPSDPWADPLRQSLITGLTGLPGVFGSYTKAVVEQLVAQSLSVATTGRPVFPTPEKLIDTFLPARMFIPERPEEQFVAWADTFNQADVGIAFNSYDPAVGQEYLFVNDVGMDKIRGHHDREARYGGERKRSIYKPITAEGLHEALWLFWYGFDAPEQHVDGCYARSIILNELTFAERIYAVKPVNDRWIGPLPKNMFDVLDMQTELWMGTSYRLQRHQIDLINHLIEDGRLGAPDPAVSTAGQKDYHPVELVPVEIETQRGFFTYFVEQMDVFEAAYHQALAQLGVDD